MMPQRFPFHVDSWNHLFILVMFCCACLVGCQGGAKPAVDAAPAGKNAAPEVVQDSLRAKFLLTMATSDGETQNLDAVLFSVPGKRYRMELTGPMGIGVASMLWQEDGWVMTFPTEKLYAKGSGYMVGIMMDNTIPVVHIHQVAGLFNGQLVPERYEIIDGGVDIPESLLDSSLQVIYGRDGMGKNFAFAKNGDDVAWLCRLGRGGLTEVLKFTEFKEFEGRRLPSQIVFERDGKFFLKIKMKKVSHDKPFSLGTWRLNVPRSFTQVGL